jgi:hypothetical protein
MVCCLLNSLYCLDAMQVPLRRYDSTEWGQLAAACNANPTCVAVCAVNDMHYYLLLESSMYVISAR